MRRVLDWEGSGGEEGGEPPAEVTQARCLSDIQKIKHTKYLTLRALADKQVADGRRALQPTFRGFVVSHSVEPSTDVLATLEFFTAAFSRSRKEAVRTDGSSLSSEVAEFRAMFRREVALASASGFGRILRAAGYPRRKGRWLGNRWCYRGAAAA